MPSPAKNLDPFAKRRHTMVERTILRRGVPSPLVLSAMHAVARERFVPQELRESAYDDCALPIGEGQTMSQPYIVALMIDALGLVGGESALEVGTGSGYSAAVLAQIAKDVYTVERFGQLSSKAARTLAGLGCSNVHVLHGDGTLGWPDHAPYDAIVVTAGGPRVPEALRQQLKVGGRLVMPVGARREEQRLVRVTRVAEHRYQTDELLDVRFVALVGAEGWPAEPARHGRS